MRPDNLILGRVPSFPTDLGIFSSPEFHQLGMPLPRALTHHKKGKLPSRVRIGTTYTRGVHVSATKTLLRGSTFEPAGRISVQPAQPKLGQAVNGSERGAFIPNAILLRREINASKPKSSGPADPGQRIRREDGSCCQWCGSPSVTWGQFHYMSHFSLVATAATPITTKTAIMRGDNYSRHYTWITQSASQERTATPVYSAQNPLSNRAKENRGSDVGLGGEISAGKVTVTETGSRVYAARPRVITPIFSGKCRRGIATRHFPMTTNTPATPSVLTHGLLTFSLPGHSPQKFLTKHKMQMLATC
jgi:hypothetical protein